MATRFCIVSWSDGSKVMYRRLDGKDPGQEADRDGDGEAVEALGGQF